MEKLSNALKSGRVVKLPPGFRFHPTDQELVVQYLKRKAERCPLPAAIIPQVAGCRAADPWDLPGLERPEHESTGEKGEDRYFFSTREAKYRNGNRSNRSTVSGYWKATGKDKPILLPPPGQVLVVGMKKTLVFYRGKPPHASRTDWVMHEYRLPHVEQSSSEDWVLCHVFLKKRNSTSNEECKQEEEEEEEDEKFPSTDTLATHSKERPVYYDFMTRDRAKPCMSTSCSSGVTDDVSDRPTASPEESSCCNSFSTFMTNP